jgi:hypothetical protein
MMKDDRCENCKFWKREEVKSPDDEVIAGNDGYCRVNPPVILGEHDHGFFPKTWCDWWCGCHKRTGASKPVDDLTRKG